MAHSDSWTMPNPTYHTLSMKQCWVSYNSGQRGHEKLMDGGCVHFGQLTFWPNGSSLDTIIFRPHVFMFFFVVYTWEVRLFAAFGEIHSNLIQYPSAIIETDSTTTVFLQPASSHLWCRNSGLNIWNFTWWACLEAETHMRQLVNFLQRGSIHILLSSMFCHILSPHFAVIQGCSASKTSRNIGRWVQGGCIWKSSDFQLFPVRDSNYHYQALPIAPGRLVSSPEVS